MKGATAVNNHDGLEKRPATERGIDSNSIFSIPHLNTKNSIFLSAYTVASISHRTTYVEAKYFKNGKETDIPLAFEPPSDYDNPKISKYILWTYASRLFRAENISVIYYTLPNLRDLRMTPLNGVEFRAIEAAINPTSAALKETVKKAITELGGRQ